MPLLSIDGTAAVAQSKSIERFLARRFNLFGANDLEAAQVDFIGEHLADIDRAAEKASVTEGANPYLKRSAAWARDELPSWLDKLEAVVALTSKKEGCLVGSTMTLADVQLFQWVSGYDELNADSTKPAVEAAVATRPRLSAAVAAVARNDKVSAHVAARKPLKFDV